MEKYKTMVLLIVLITLCIGLGYMGGYKDGTDGKAKLVAEACVRAYIQASEELELDTEKLNAEALEILQKGKKK